MQIDDHQLTWSLAISCWLCTTSCGALGKRQKLRLKQHGCLNVFSFMTMTMRLTLLYITLLLSFFCLLLLKVSSCFHHTDTRHTHVLTMQQNCMYVNKSNNCLLSAANSCVCALQRSCIEPDRARKGKN